MGLVTAFYREGLGPRARRHLSRSSLSPEMHRLLRSNSCGYDVPFASKRAGIFWRNHWRIRVADGRFKGPPRGFRGRICWPVTEHFVQGRNRQLRLCALPICSCRSPLRGISSRRHAVLAEKRPARLRRYMHFSGRQACRWACRGDEGPVAVDPTACGALCRQSAGRCRSRLRSRRVSIRTSMSTVCGFRKSGPSSGRQDHSGRSFEHDALIDQRAPKPAATAGRRLEIGCRKPQQSRVKRPSTAFGAARRMKPKDAFALSATRLRAARRGQHSGGRNDARLLGVVVSNAMP